MEAERPSKKQRELLNFIDNFIAVHGYGPSYREIMRGCGYTSVATVATHVDNLILKGHLRKKERSARSLEVVGATKEFQISSEAKPEKEAKWLVQKIGRFFTKAESGEVTQAKVDELYVLTGALKVLGLEGAYQSFLPRLSALKKRIGKR